MNLLLRVLYVFISSFFKPKIGDLLAPSLLKLCVLPNDLDFNLHMNNGRYLTIMDLGRLDLILRTGLFKIMVQQKSVPILASAKIRYRLSLDPFQKYTLQTQILGWDEKWFYIEQRFLMGSGAKQGEVAAIGLVKGCFLNNTTQSTVPTSDVLTAIGYPYASPLFPQHITDWLQAEETLKNVTRNA
ncbi:MAG: Mesenchymal stem cell protein DSCD75 [Alphaproteobacteria bacterium RIFCSPHIGHO2_12_FULL_45_9]|nr:MAG: Mesenchymal stem cell protein DSCD75 [Alphaproteobacteria bacterium RIFCSPHIGHO2_02_FULL_46_13]OFW94921.1 MAG: Mesenchymal stem cell protein DSCD75 [Alphaproteobacteria bacterium RIFCSPHIGHO2_12_FULL_45_9]